MKTTIVFNATSLAKNVKEEQILIVLSVKEDSMYQTVEFVRYVWMEAFLLKIIPIAKSAILRVKNVPKFRSMIV